MEKRFYKTSCPDEEIINVFEIISMWKVENPTNFKNKFYMKGSNDIRELVYEKEIPNALELRNKDFAEIEKLMQSDMKGGNMKEGLKEFFVKHKDIILFIGLFILIDHFVLGGRLRKKLAGLLDKIGG